MLGVTTTGLPLLCRAGRGADVHPAYSHSAVFLPHGRPDHGVFEVFHACMCVWVCACVIVGLQF